MRRAFRRIRAIFLREYRQRVQNKWFLLTTFGIPLLFVGLSLLPAFLIGGSEEARSPIRVGVVDRVGLEEGRLGELITAADSLVLTEPADVSAETSPDRLARRLQTTGLDAYLVVDSATLRGEEATLITREALGEIRQRIVRDALRQALVLSSLRRAGMAEVGADSLYRQSRVGLNVVQPGARGVQSQAVAAGVALALTFILYMMFIIYGQIITRGVLEEKTSDIAEVLVSSVRPWELMTGKILGIGSVGLTQIAIWVVILGVLAAYGLMGGALAGLAEAGISISSLGFPVWEVGGAFLVYFVLGFFLFSTAFAAVGAMVGDEQEVQQVSFPVMMLIIVPFILAITGLETPDAGWFRAAALFPFFSPILMIVRITLGVAALWEVAVSTLLLVVTLAACAWLTGRIYRVGILMKGKRPDLPELMRWIRYG